MNAPLFHYLSPKILPVFPREIGTVRVLLDAQHVLNTRAYREFSGELQVGTRVFAGGAALSDVERSIRVDGNRVGIAPEWESFCADDFGYVEFSFEASEAVFLKILPEPGYALLEVRDRGAITLNSDMKYANPRVVQQIKHYSRFCMLHSAVYVDSARGIGNSLLLINPYDQALRARITAAEGGRLVERLEPKVARLVDLSSLTTDGAVTTVMVSASNRVITYDVKHAYGEPGRINSIDHLDPFSGYETHQSHVASDALRYAWRQLGRRVGLRRD